ncbi:MAG: hypothetical protein EPO26_10830 [Chloroflexota bacterium]|nr:MAG: hypothetical protein EPO26_10830 [Chloroflexota bacterium]
MSETTALASARVAQTIPMPAFVLNLGTDALVERLARIASGDGIEPTKSVSLALSFRVEAAAIAGSAAPGIRLGSQIIPAAPLEPGILA